MIIVYLDKIEESILVFVEDIVEFLMNKLRENKSRIEEQAYISLWRKKERWCH